MSLNRTERYMIHRFIIAIIIMIPVIISIDTAYIMHKSEGPFPREYRVTTADGVITDKFRTNAGRGYIVVNGQEHWVKESVMSQYAVGNHIILTEFGGQNGWDMIRIILFFIVCLALLCGAVFCVFYLFELYFAWLKG